MDHICVLLKCHFIIFFRLIRAYDMNVLIVFLNQYFDIYAYKIYEISKYICNLYK